MSEIIIDEEILKEQLELVQYTERILQGCIERGSEDFIITQYKNLRNEYFQEALRLMSELYPSFPKEIIDRVIIQ